MSWAWVLLLLLGVVTCVLAVCLRTTQSLVKHDDDDLSPALEYPFLTGILAYTNDSNTMWKNSDFLVPGSSPPQSLVSLIFAVGQDTAAAQVSDMRTFASLTDDLQKQTGTEIPVMWYWSDWYHSRLTTAAAMTASLLQWSLTLRGVTELPVFGIQLMDEPGAAEFPEWPASLLLACQTIKVQFPSAVCYCNFRFDTLFTAHGDGTITLTAFGQTLGACGLDWVSCDEYYDYSPETFYRLYHTVLYPVLNAQQKVMLLPFAAQCEIPGAGCAQNQVFVPDPDHARYHQFLFYRNWALQDTRVAGLCVYRFKNIWWNYTISTQTSNMQTNPSGAGIGLVDQCYGGTDCYGPLSTAVAPALRCTSDAECGPGAACGGGACYTTCTSDVDCSAYNMLCTTLQTNVKVCYPSCYIDAACPAGLTCDLASTRCVPVGQ